MKLCIGKETCFKCLTDYQYFTSQISYGIYCPFWSDGHAGSSSKACSKPKEHLVFRETSAWLERGQYLGVTTWKCTIQSKFTVEVTSTWTDDKEPLLICKIYEAGKCCAGVLSLEHFQQRFVNNIPLVNLLIQKHFSLSFTISGGTSSSSLWAFRWRNDLFCST